MAAMSVPTSGRIYLDSSILIYSVERHPVFAPLLDPLWAAFARGQAALFTSELSILETLVLPIRQRDQQLVNAFERMFSDSGLQMIGIDGAILRSAAELRAVTPSLRAPDSIHIASARTVRADVLLTNDRKLATVAGSSGLLLVDLQVE
jgi:predicted nucleic acid-binding protein